VIRVARTAHGGLARAKKCEQEQRESGKQQYMHGVVCAVDGNDTNQPRDEQGERGLEEHVSSDAATRSGDEQDGYALEVVNGAWKEIDKNWRGPPVETANGTTPDVSIRRSDDSGT
jgi:hypothetical protein